MSHSNLSPPSNSENNKEFVHNFVEDAFNKHDMEAIDKYYTVNLIQHNPQVPQGREGFKQYFGGFFQRFSDSRTTIDHVVAEGDKSIRYDDYDCH